MEDGMNLSRDRMRSIGWVFVLTTCFVLTMALTFKVNSVKSQVRLAERQIVSLQRQKLMLETEFATRANQQQLRALNEVEFGYNSPESSQYLETERKLAALGKPRAPGAPAPIRVATVVGEESANVFPAMVSPLTGKAIAAELSETPEGRKVAADLKHRVPHGIESRVERQ
jgi:hypothetical protein